MNSEVEPLLEEYDLTVDDIRYYLAFKTAEELLSFEDNPLGLARMIWSGELESRLHNMADRFLEEQQEELRRNITDESRLREKLREAVDVKRRRRLQ